MTTRVKAEPVANGQFAQVLSSEVDDVLLEAAPPHRPHLSCAGSICENGCCQRISFFIMTGNGCVACKVELDDAVDIAEHILNEVGRLRRT